MTINSLESRWIASILSASSESKYAATCMSLGFESATGIYHLCYGDSDEEVAQTSLRSRLKHEKLFLVLMPPSCFLQSSWIQCKKLVESRVTARFWPSDPFQTSGGTKSVSSLVEFSLLALLVICSTAIPSVTFKERWAVSGNRLFFFPSLIPQIFKDYDQLYSLPVTLWGRGCASGPLAGRAPSLVPSESMCGAFPG